LQNPSQTNGHNVKNVCHETIITFRNKKREYQKKLMGLKYRGINEFKKGYQPRTNLVKDENGDLLAGSHTIFTS